MSALGPVVSVHVADRVGLGCIGMLVAFFLSLAASCGGATLGGLAEPGWHSVVGVGLTAIPAAGAFWARRWLGRVRPAVWAVHEGGLSIGAAPRAREIRWEEIEAVWVRIVAGSPPRRTLHHLVTAAGPVDYPGLLDDSMGLTSAILDHTRDRPLQAALAAIDRGEWAPFGAIAVSTSGVRVRDALIPWAAVERVVHRRSSVGVRLRDGRERAVFTDEMPDAHALLPLLERLAPRP